MGSLPSLRATGHKMWTRIRPNLSGVTPPVFARAAQESEARLASLRLEVERLSAVRSNVERATQLARVLDAVSALAASHGLTDAELSALRSVPLDSVATPGPLGLRQQLRQRATDVVAQVWAQGPITSITGLAFGATPVVSVPAAAATPLPAQPNARGRRATRSPFVLRVGAGAGRAAGRAGMQLIAASLLHLPRLHRQLVVVRRGADLAMQGAGVAMQGAGIVLQTAKLVTSPPPTLASSVRSVSIPPLPTRTTATSLLLWSGRSSLQLTYEIASAGAQLLLRRYVLPRVLRYLSNSVTRREIVPARPLRTAR